MESKRRVLAEKDLYRPIVGRLSSLTPQPPILQSYLSIFHSGAEVPLGTFTQDTADNGYVEAIAGLLQKRVLAVKLREGVAVVYAKPIESVIKFKE